MALPCFPPREGCPMCGPPYETGFCRQQSKQVDQPDKQRGDLHPGLRHDELGLSKTVDRKKVKRPAEAHIAKVEQERRHG